jgi:hypothetical protein
MKNYKKGFVGIIAVIAIVAAGFLGYGAYKAFHEDKINEGGMNISAGDDFPVDYKPADHKDKSAISNNISIEQNTKVNDSLVVNDTNLKQNIKDATIDTQNWKVYRDNLKGFEFQYPTGWSIQELKDNYDIVGGQLYNTGYKIIPSDTNGSKDQIIIDYRRIFCKDVVGTKKCIEKRGNSLVDLIIYTQSENPEINKIFDLITDKLIPINIGLGLNNGKYVNSKYGFELTFPDRWKNLIYQEKFSDGTTGISFKLKYSQGVYKSIYTDAFFVIIMNKDKWYESGLQGQASSIVMKDNLVYVYFVGGNDDGGFDGFPSKVAGEVYKGAYYDVKNIIIPSFKFTK